MADTNSPSQWRRFLDEAFAFNVAQSDTRAPRRVAIWVALGLALFIGLAVSPVASAAAVAIAGFAFVLTAAVVEGALAFRRVRLAKPRRLG
jgi:hypothetical protein